MAQGVHSSVDPVHIVNWDSTGLHSSVNPALWVSPTREKSEAGKEKQPLKEPIIPYASESAKREAEAAKKQEVFQTGEASYYSSKMHGRKMADGTSYDRNAFTCAHRTLPFGTMVRVVNKKNGKETVVKVTDRGPFGKGRVIDLSNSAASELGMISDGIAKVELYVMQK